MKWTLHHTKPLTRFLVSSLNGDSSHWGWSSEGICLLRRCALLSPRAYSCLGQVGALQLDRLGVGTTLEGRFWGFRSVFHRMDDFLKSVFLVYLSLKEKRNMRDGI